MTLNKTESGKVYIADATKEAMAFIDGERERLIEPNHQHWVFSRPYYGRIYILTYPHEDKTELVRLIDILIGKYGLKMSNEANYIQLQWHAEAAEAWKNAENNRKRRVEHNTIEHLKRIVRSGCNQCSNLVISQEYDDTIGCCTYSNTLLASKFVFENGKNGFDLIKKFYPCGGCKYLEEGKE